MEQKVIKARVSGIVQGVCFREYTRRTATKLGLRGWVKNCSDGTVETVFGGTPDQVQEMIAWLHRGSPHSLVEQVHIQRVETELDPLPFRIVF